MHPSALYALLPLLALGVQAAPSGTKLPLPLIRARQALDLPPSLVTASAASDASFLPSASASVPAGISDSSVSDTGDYGQDQDQEPEDDTGTEVAAAAAAGSGVTPTPTAWKIDSVPLSKAGTAPPTLPTLLPTPLQGKSGVTASAVVTALPTGTQTSGVITAPRKGDSLITPSPGEGGMVAAAAAVTSIAGMMVSPTPAISASAESENATTDESEQSTDDGSDAQVQAEAFTTTVTITSYPTSTADSGAYTWTAVSLDATATATATTPADPLATTDVAGIAATSIAITSGSASASASGSASTSFAATASSTAGPEPERKADDTEHAKKIRYKHCSDIGGTVTQISVSPCEGGKGTINDPCHFHAGSNYTISLTYVPPFNSSQPRSNLLARDRTQSSGTGSDKFPYPGQSFDGCEYTTCPIIGQESSVYTYTFETLNTRFDQLTFNMTDGLDGESLMCAYFPVTFMPHAERRDMYRRVPFAGLGGRW
ncbi:hypothetical protein IAU60_006294 [Kwoniella sp. DSM 27419]